MKDWRRLDLMVWATLAVVIAIVIKVAVGMNVSVNQEIEEEYGTYQSVLAESSAKTLRLFFAEVETELKLLSKIPAVQQLYQPGVKKELRAIVKKHGDLVSTIMLLNYAGDIVVDPLWMNRSEGISKNIKTIFREMVIRNEELQNLTGELEHTILTDEIVVRGQFEGFALAVPVYKKLQSGSTALFGMIVALIKREELERNLLRPISFKDASTAMLISHSGAIFTSPKEDGDLALSIITSLGFDKEGRRLYEKALVNGGKGTIWREVRTPAREGGDSSKLKRVLLSLAGVKVAGVSWGIGIITPRDEIVKLVSKSARQSLLLAGFVVAILYLGALALLKLNKTRISAQEKARYAGELSKQNEELERLNKMKDEFVSIVSHDLRSPIGTISSYAKLMLPEIEKFGGNVRPVEAIIRSSERITALVNDILDLARVEAGELKLHYSEVEVDHLVHESFRAIQFNAKQKSIELVYEPGTEPKTILGDNNKLYQVLNNLIGNAIKFTPDGGVVTVRKTVRDGNLLMSVSDNGPGLAEAELELVFERFKQTGNHAGSGLGLAICKNLVELHNGNIWVESPPGKGADFKFTVPILSEMPAESRNFS